MELDTTSETIRKHGHDTDRLASDRTKLALQRNLLAVERTFSAWIRTGLTSIISGLGIAKLIDVPILPWIPQVIGALFTIVGGGIFVVALWRYYKGRRKLHLRGVKLIPLWLMGTLAIMLFIGAVLAFVLLVLT